MQLRCIRCGTPVQGVAQYCPDCAATTQAQSSMPAGEQGQPAPPPAAIATEAGQACPVCAARSPAGATYCMNCGHGLIAANLSGQGNVALQRVIAFIIDSVLTFLVAVPFMHFTRETISPTGQRTTTFGFRLGTTESILWALFIFAYFVLLEWGLGATLGKMLLGLRVRGRNLQPASFGRVLLRNILRIVDAFPYFIPYVVGLITIATSSGRERVGDKAAGTVVVRG